MKAKEILEMKRKICIEAFIQATSNTEKFINERIISKLYGYAEEGRPLVTSFRIKFFERWGKEDYFYLYDRVHDENVFLNFTIFTKLLEENGYSIKEDVTSAAQRISNITVFIKE